METCYRAVTVNIGHVCPAQHNKLCLPTLRLDVHGVLLSVSGVYVRWRRGEEQIEMVQCGYKLLSQGKQKTTSSPCHTAHTAWSRSNKNLCPKHSMRTLENVQINQKHVRLKTREGKSTVCVQLQDPYASVSEPSRSLINDFQELARHRDSSPSV